MFRVYINIVYCTFGIRDCVRVKEDLVISRFCPIYFTVTLVGLKSIVRFTGNFVIQGFVDRGSTVEARDYKFLFSYK